MARRSPTEQLDEAVNAMMSDPKAPIPRVTPRLAALLRVAADLRELPAPEFKARLRTALLSGAPKMVAHDLRAALGDLPEMTMRFLASLNGATIGVTRFSGPAHWERHPAGDELLHVLEGEADVITLTDRGPVRSHVRAGSLFICPQGLWHRVVPRSPLSLLFATPGEGTEHSSARQPARRGRTPRRGRDKSPRRPTLRAHELAAALEGLPELAISASTTAAEADAAVRAITTLDGCTLGVMRYSGLTPWERHPGGDELLHVLDGAVDVTVLTAEGPAEVTVHAGSVFVCPRGLWHRQLPRPAVTMLFGTPVETTEISSAEDPRVGAS